MTRSGCVAIIPARGGSKRIPRKNIVDFLGVPLIAWTIAAAREFQIFDKIVVSTDDPEIAEISKAFGAECPALRTEKSDDVTPVSEATIFTLQQLEEEGYAFETVVQLFSVCPLRNASDIESALAFHAGHGRSFTISCSTYALMNPWWALEINRRGEGRRIHEGALSQRSQDLPPLYCPSGAIWIANVEALYREGTFYGQGHLYWEMDWIKAIDIDMPEELELAMDLAKAKGFCTSPPARLPPVNLQETIQPRGRVDVLSL